MSGQENAGGDRQGDATTDSQGDAATDSQVTDSADSRTTGVAGGSVVVETSDCRLSGRVIDLRERTERAVPAERVVAAVRRRRGDSGDGSDEETAVVGPDAKANVVDHDVAVTSPDPGSAHEYVGLVEPGMSLRSRTALAAAARSRGLSAPQDEELASVRAELADLSVPEVDTERARERVAGIESAVEAGRERVATVRGRLQAARDDDDVTSLTNVLGSNTFNLLVAIPVGVLLAGSATINFLAAIPTMGFLALATIVFIVFLRTDLRLTDREAVGFLVLYGVFLVWMTLESIGAIETVRGI